MTEWPGTRNAVSGLVVLSLIGAWGVSHPSNAQVGGTHEGTAAGTQRFFGLTPPGSEPQKFWPEILTAEAHPHGQLAFWPDGRGVFWSAIPPDAPDQTIFSSAFDGRTFSKPEVAPFAAGYGSGFPAFSPDGKHLFFSAVLPPAAGSSERLEAIYVVEKTGSGWSKPVPIASTVDSRTTVGQLTVARSGNIYFVGRALSDARTGLYVCRSHDGKFLPPEKLGGPLASERRLADPWVDPDERFMLLAYFPEVSPPALTDLAISYRRAHGEWGRPLRLGGSVNSPAFERFPSLSPDGKHLFFVRSYSEGFVGKEAHFYWVDAKILDKMKPESAQ